MNAAALLIATFSGQVVIVDGDLDVAELVVVVVDERVLAKLQTLSHLDVCDMWWRLCRLDFARLLRHSGSCLRLDAR